MVIEKVLVTGGAGFIGSHLVDKLIRDGYDVLVIDNLSKGNIDNINTKAAFEKIDIRDLSKLEKVFNVYKPHCVFHLAAISSFQDEIKNVNLNGTKNILNACLKSGTKRIIFSSSAAIYGNASIFPTSENQITTPISEYGISKAAAESEIISFSEKSGLSFSILRYSNVYGPRQRSDTEGGVVSIFLKGLLTNKTVEIFGRGNQTRDFIYADDVVKATILSACKISKNFIANISTAKETSIDTLLKIIEKVANIEAKFVYAKPRAGEIQRSCLNNKMAEEFLGWKPLVTLNNGIEKTYYSLR